MNSELRFIPVFLLLAGVSMIMLSVSQSLARRFPFLISTRSFRWLFAIFVLCSVLDMHSTLRLMSALGLDAEGSPIPHAMFKLFGKTGMVILRLTLINIFFYFIYKKHPELLIGMGIAYPLYIVSNYYQVLSHEIPLF